MVYKLSLKTSGTFDIPLEDLVECVFDHRQELILPHINKMHESIKFFNGQYSVHLTPWKKKDDNNDNNEYMSISCSFDINDPLYLRLTAQEGYMDDHGDIMDTDGFLEIKGDRESLTQAVAAILNGTIPLHNRDFVITEETCPYALLDW